MIDRPLPPPHRLLGLRHAVDVAAARIEGHWRAPVVIGLLATIPAFYLDLLEGSPPGVAALAYLLAAGVLLAALAHTALRTRQPLRHVAGNALDLLLAAGLAGAALLPNSEFSSLALMFRLAVSLLTLVRILWALQHWVTRGSLIYMLVVALGLLGLCGAGFWWLEPSVHSFADGLWLAFTTAATVGYGDIVPTAPAAKIFSAFVVLLGFGVLSLVTAAIAASWIETEERRIEREILHDLRRQLGNLHAEMAALRSEIRSGRGPVK